LTTKIRPLGLISCLITKQTNKQTSKRGLYIRKSAVGIPQFIKDDAADNPRWKLRLIKSLGTPALVRNDRNIKATKWQRHRKI